MSEPIDLDDLQRVGILVRIQLDDNWLADMVEIAAAEIARLREERQGSRRAATSLRLLEFLRKDPRSRKLVVCCASIKSIKGEDAIGALNFEVEGKPFVVNFLWEDDLFGDIDRAVTSAIYAIEKEG